MERFLKIKSNRECLSRYSRQSLLKTSLDKIEIANNFKEKFEILIGVKYLPGISAVFLSQSYLKSSKASKEIIISGSNLKCLNDLTSSLKGRKRQQ